MFADRHIEETPGSSQVQTCRELHRCSDFLRLNKAGSITAVAVYLTGEVESAKAGEDQASVALSIGSCGPVEESLYHSQLCQTWLRESTYAKVLIPDVLRLHSNGGWVIIRYPSVLLGIARGACNIGICNLLRAWAWKISILDNILIVIQCLESASWSGCTNMLSCEDWDAEEDLSGWKALLERILHPLISRSLSISKSVQLRVVAGCRSPRPRVVVAHEVQKVEILVSLIEWDVFEVPLGRRQSRGEDKLVVAVKANVGEKGDEVATILFVFWVLPINYIYISPVFSCGREDENTLSIPSNPPNFTSDTADLAKVSLVDAAAATEEKFSLELPPPPMERRTFKCGFSLFKAIRDPRQPRAPSTSCSMCLSSLLSFPFVSKSRLRTSMDVLLTKTLPFFSRLTKA